MIIAPNMCPFKGEIIAQLNEAKRKEQEIRMSNFVAMDTRPDDETKNKTKLEELPFRKKWLLKETRNNRHQEHSYKEVRY